jgi:hypothetical protein
MTLPRFLHGSECWTPNKQQENRDEVAELPCRLQGNRSCQKPNRQELDILNILNKTVQYYTNLFLQLERMKERIFNKIRILKVCSKREEKNRIEGPIMIRFLQPELLSLLINSAVSIETMEL